MERTTLYVNIVEISNGCFNIETDFVQIASAIASFPCKDFFMVRWIVREMRYLLREHVIVVDDEFVSANDDWKQIIPILEKNIENINSLELW